MIGIAYVWVCSQVPRVRKEVRAAVEGLGLADAKKIVENVPSTLKENLTEAEAEALILQLEKAGLEAQLYMQF